MAAKQTWISEVKSVFEKSPIVSNVFFGFLLIFLEKLVETEFECPCNPEVNAWFAFAFFVVPAVLVFLLMIKIRGCRKKWSKEAAENLFLSSIPATMWLILLFLDGQYFACAKTFWSGRYVINDEAAPQKWCEPDNHIISSHYLMIITQRWFSVSQGVAMGLILLLTLTLGVYLIYDFKKEKKEERQEEDTEGRRTDDSPHVDHEAPEKSVAINV